MFRRTAAIFAICPWQTEPVATSRDPSEPICLLERLGNEPFWDNVPIVRSPLSGLGEAASATSCRPKNSTLLPAKLELLVEELHWPSLRQYLQPLTYLSYADAVQNQDRQGRGFLPTTQEQPTCGRLSWKFPSWRAEGPLHETMTLSDGFNSFWHSLQEVLREDSCSTAPCLAALLLGEIMQLAREVLARPLHRHSLDDLWHVLRQPLPWKSWLHSSWALPLLESLLTLLKALPSLADVDLVMRAQMQEILKDLLAATDCKVAAEDFLMSNFQSLWQNDAAYLRPVLRLVADCLTPPAQSSPFFLSERRLSHALCENTVQSMNMGEDIVAHLHGASAFIQVDHMGRSWLRLEFLHFVSTTDGTVRLMVYGNRKQDRMYYAQALTLPRGLVKKWRCSLDGVTEDARLASFFGYDAVAYCDLPLVPGSERKELQPSLSMGSAYTNNFRLCLPQKKRWRLAACTQPLHSFAKMEQLAPTLLKDFLDYHQLLGIEHFTIFDADGSLSGPLERYRAGDERKVEIEYVDHWPERLGAAHATGGSDWRPLLFEVEAENYCLWRYRGQADWAVVLHSPDVLASDALAVGTVSAHSAMSSLCYRMTFIDEASEPLAPVNKRAKSCPPVMKEAVITKYMSNLCRFQHEDKLLTLQVSTLQERSELLLRGAEPNSPSSSMQFQVTSSLGGYGHPNICRRPCILFLRGRCEKAQDCGFCHMHHDSKLPSFDKQQRDFLRHLPLPSFLEMILPYVQKHVEESDLPSAADVLQLFKSEIAIRSYSATAIPQRTPRKIRYVLERMSLASLVSSVCSVVPGRFPKIMSNQLKELRETARMLES
eukprot:symbB.v1.2.034541.t1/scaffold4476.1/size41083/4